MVEGSPVEWGSNMHMSVGDIKRREKRLYRFFIKKKKRKEKKEIKSVCFLPSN